VDEERLAKIASNVNEICESFAKAGDPGGEQAD
jgi:hypothetical protein